jgi:hypothetical protein
MHFGFMTEPGETADEPQPLELPVVLPVPKLAPPTPRGHDDGADDDAEPRSRVIVIELA